MPINDCYCATKFSPSCSFRPDVVRFLFFPSLARRARYLAAHPDNVVAIHCKAGKGRTGLMISAYLLWSEMFCSANDALAYFGNKRTRNGKGVTIPSQKRYVHYFESFLREFYCCKRPFNFLGPSYVVTSVKITTIPRCERDGGCNIYFKIFDHEGEKLHDSRKTTPVKHYKSEPSIQILSGARINGDVKFIFYNEDKVRSDQKIFWFWINTNFVQQNYLAFTKPQIDKAHKDKKGVYDEAFKVELWFRPDDIILESLRPLPAEG